MDRPDNVDLQQAIEAVIGRVSRAAWTEIEKQCRPGETPFLVLGQAMGGVLVAFEDRCSVIKKGLAAMTTPGSGTVVTFLYSQITGIEYTRGLGIGQLVVLNASYQGGRSRASIFGVDLESDRHATAPNAIALGRKDFERARPHIERMQALVAQSDWQKRDHAASSAVIGHGLVSGDPLQSQSPETAGVPNLGDEIAKLSELHAAGTLDEQEFRDAKAAAIARAASDSN